MKKLLFALIAFTMLTTSCYKKDFEDLNAKIDAQTASLSGLGSQISSIATLVAGIPALQTSINTLQTSVTALGTSLAALTTTVNSIKTSVDGLTTNLAALTAAVGVINTNLNTLAANVAANQVTTVGLLNDIKTQAAANQASLTALIISVKADLQAAITAGNNAVIAALTAKMDAVQTALNASIAASQAAIIANANTNTANIVAAVNAAKDATIAAIQLQINTLQANLLAAIAAGNAAVIAQLQSDIAAAQAAIIANDNANTAYLADLITGYSNALLAALAIINAKLNTLLDSNDIYLGDLTITNEPQLVYAESLGAKVRAIKGNVYIDASTFDASQLARLKNVTNNEEVLPPFEDNPFIGIVVGTVQILGSNSIDVSKMVTVSGDVYVDGPVSHNLSGLIAVNGNYFVGNAGIATDPQDDALKTVTGGMWVNQYFGYSYPNLTTVGGGLTLVSNAWTSTIELPALTSNVDMNDGPTNGASPNGVLTYDVANHIIIGACSGLWILNANSASFITLGEDQYIGGSLTITSASALNVNMPNMQGLNGPLTINTPNAAGVNLSGLITLTSGGIAVTTDNSPAGIVNFANYTGSGNNNPVAVFGPTTLDMPKFLGNLGNQDVISPTVITGTFAKFQMAPGADFNGLAVCQNLTIGDVKNDVNDGNLNETPLKHLWITASSYVVDVYLNTNFDALLTVSTAGLLHGLKDDGNNVLTTVTTAGVMDRFEMWHNPLLVTVSMGHNYYQNVLGEGAWVDVWDNAVLPSLTTSNTGGMKTLFVGSNPSMSAVNFSSYVVGQNITAGGINVTVTSDALVGTFAGSIFATNTPPVMVQAGLSTLKAYVLNLMGNPAYTVFLSLGYHVGGGAPTDNSITTLDNDRAAFILAGGSGATSFVQRDGDVGGDVGSKINVARELGYIQ